MPLGNLRRERQKGNRPSTSSFGTTRTFWTTACNFRPLKSMTYNNKEGVEDIARRLSQARPRTVVMYATTHRLDLIRRILVIAANSG